MMKFLRSIQRKFAPAPPKDFLAEWTAPEPKRALELPPLEESLRTVREYRAPDYAFSTTVAHWEHYDYHSPD